MPYMVKISLSSTLSENKKYKKFLKATFELELENCWQGYGYKESVKILHTQFENVENIINNHKM